jgi:hypothetical protein
LRVCACEAVERASRSASTVRTNLLDKMYDLS